MPEAKKQPVVIDNSLADKIEQAEASLDANEKISVETISSPMNLVPPDPKAQVCAATPIPIDQFCRKEGFSYLYFFAAFAKFIKYAP